MATKITARDVDKIKRTPEEITTLARRHLTREVLVTADRRAIESAFYMMLALVPMTKPATERIGALIGDYSEAVRGRSMNGYPIFLSMGFLHKKDVDAFDAEVDRMRVAMGLPVREA